MACSAYNICHLALYRQRVPPLLLTCCGRGSLCLCAIGTWAVVARMLFCKQDLDLLSVQRSSVLRLALPLCSPPPPLLSLPPLSPQQQAHYTCSIPVEGPKPVSDLLEVSWHLPPLPRGQCSRLSWSSGCRREFRE